MQGILHSLATVVRRLGMERDLLHRKLVGDSILVGEAFDFVEGDICPIFVFRLADFHAVRIVRLRESPIVVSRFGRDIQADSLPRAFDGLFREFIQEFVGVSAGIGWRICQRCSFYLQFIRIARLEGEAFDFLKMQELVIGIVPHFCRIPSIG